MTTKNVLESMNLNRENEQNEPNRGDTNGLHARY